MQDRSLAKVELGQMLGVGITVAVVGIAIAFSLDIVGDTKDDMGADACALRSDGFTSYNVSADQCYNSTGDHDPVGTAEFNATEDAITGLAKLPSKLPLIITVVVAAIVIGLLVRHFAFKG